MKISSLKAIWYSGPMLPELDEMGRSLYFRGGDLLARIWLNDMTMPEFNAGNREGAAMLVHAEQYLADRQGYELAPWPKGKIKIPIGLITRAS